MSSEKSELIRLDGTGKIGLVEHHRTFERMRHTSTETINVGLLVSEPTRARKCLWWKKISHSGSATFGAATHGRDTMVNVALPTSSQTSNLFEIHICWVALGENKKELTNCTWIHSLWWSHDPEFRRGARWPSRHTNPLELGDAN